MKRIALVASFALAVGLACVVASPDASARRPHATPSPSPTPIAAPTATPEPPQIAIPRLQAKLKANPNDQQAMLDLAAEYVSVNQPQAALPITQRLLQQGNKTAQVYYYDGTAQLAAGNVAAATADFEQASNLAPTNLGVLTQLTELYLRENRAADAERVAKRAVTFNTKPNAPEDAPQAYENLGLVYASEGKFDDARAQLELAVKLEPKNTGPIVQIANTYQAQNNIPMALQTIDRALAIAPRDVQVLVYKANLYAKEHDDTHVGRAFDDAVVAATSDAQKVEILARKAAYYVQEKKNPIALGILTQMVAAYPKEPGAHVAYGDYLAQNKQTSQAEGEWKTALGLDKDNVAALQRMGQVSLQSGKFTDAIGYLKHLNDVNPSPQGFAMLGQAYSFVHDYSRSRDACGKSFEMQRTPETLGCIAGADYELKNYKEASRIFDILDGSAKGFLDQNPTLLFVAAKTYEHAKDNAKAIAIYKRLLGHVRKGTKDYKLIEHSIAMLSRHSAKSKHRG